jgi:hypothetical protein
METATTVRWLKLASAVVFGFGILIAFAAMPMLAGPTLILTDIILFPMDGGQSLASPETRILCAILGGITAGWGALLWLISTRLYPHDPVLGRSLILTSVWVWFCIDSTASVLAVAPYNVLLNMLFLAMFVVPLSQKALPAASQ